MDNLNAKKRKRISKQQEDEAIRLYESGKYSIAEILSITGIRSSQSVYRIFKKRSITRRISSMKVSITLDTAAADIVRREKPTNLSRWISRIIREVYGR